MIKRGATKWAVGEQVLATDLNETINSKNIKINTSTYTATIDDDIIIMKPNNTANTYTQVTIGGGYWDDKNYTVAGTTAYGHGSIDGFATGLIKINLTTQTLITHTAITNFSPNGMTPLGVNSAGTYLYFVDYNARINRLDIGAGTVTVGWATTPSAVYSLAIDQATGDIYTQGYTGVIYKTTSAGTTTTVTSSGGWGSFIGIMCWDSVAGALILTGNGTTTYKITPAGVVTTLTNYIKPQGAWTFYATNQSVYYKRQLAGNAYYMRASTIDGTETMIGKANIPSYGGLFFDGTYLYEGSSGSADQFFKTVLANLTPLNVVTLPTPSAGNTGKEVTISAPYGFTNTPFVVGKMLFDYTPTNTDNTQTLISFPFSSWSANTRAIRFISDGTYWIAMRQ